MTLPLVLLPGHMCDARLFAPQLARFSRDRATMVGSLCQEDTVSDLARRVLDDAPQTFALAGLSFGGIVAMEVIKLAPDRVARLALLDTNPLPEPVETAAHRAQFVDRVKRGALEAVMREDLKPRYLAPGPARSGLLDLCLDMALDLGADVFERQSRAISSRPDQTETLKTVSVPTLVLCGAEDGLCPPERHRFMHQLVAGSMLTMVPGAGHLPVLEQPERTNDALAAWLAE